MHVNALLLQNCEYYFVDGLKKELCALECRNMHPKCEKNYHNIMVAFFFNQDGKNAYITQILVYYSVNRLFCLNSRDTVSVIYGLSLKLFLVNMYLFFYITFIR